MVEKNDKDVLLDHDYDGIQELDNDLPPWWLWLFYISIIWSVFYLIHFHVLGTGDSSEVEYLKEINPDLEITTNGTKFSIGYQSPFYASAEEVTPLSRIQTALAKEKEAAILAAQKEKEGGGLTIQDLSFKEIMIAAMGAASGEDLNKLKNTFPKIWTEYQAGESVEKEKITGVKEPDPVIEPLTDTGSLAAGEAIYIANCITCHGKLGEGGIGPNMTDEYFIHGFTLSNMITTILNGVPAKGMISWRSILKEKQILQVASYILTLRGSNSPNAKAPQGEKAEIFSN
jgi:mono/diheme cytochrome c family protein